MRSYGDDDEVDFAIVGTGAGGGTLTCKLASVGLRVVAFDAGPFWRPLEDFASDEKEQQKLYWQDERISGGADPIQFGANNRPCPSVRSHRAEDPLEPRVDTVEALRSE
jgi:choline dehydrogenase-like flavoprotein